ncbi:hypothetical protein [Streptomyces sp. 8L]|uniref:hypothetical protein n=1 Tax=Streptomyces sp. 8L TaxID=2877242 RepID=UPI001CD47D25|nr:hypothetical protein [Streptomyces sp. 8L]MCA1221693.1 hypothetical protein [Streptomyces sp. 8L]
MAVPQGVGVAWSPLFYGGSRAAFEARGPAPRALGGNSVYLGEDAGAAALHDLSLLGVPWTSPAGAPHGCTPNQR